MRRGIGGGPAVGDGDGKGCRLERNKLHPDFASGLGQIALTNTSSFLKRCGPAMWDWGMIFPMTAQQHHSAISKAATMDSHGNLHC